MFVIFRRQSQAGSATEACQRLDPLNPFVTNGFSNPYHLDESTFVLGALGVIFHLYFIFG